MTENQPSSEDNRTKAFYDRISGAYDLLSDASEHKARECGIERLAVTPGEAALEIGFGTGHALVDLARAVGPKGRVAGIDVSSGMCEQARGRLEREGLENRVTLQCAATPPLPYEDGEFDVVFLSFTLELFALEVIPEVLAEVRRVLKPGGRVGMVSMAEGLPGEKDSLLEKTYKWMHQHFPHIVDCQPIQAESLVEAAGFELAHQERLQMFTMPVAVVVGVNLKV